jgi:ketosteroid isomerase-like protein
VHGTPVTDDEVALEAVRRLHGAWLAAELRGDIEGVLALCTSDVRWLVPDAGMLVGHD